MAKSLKKIRAEMDQTKRDLMKICRCLYQNELEKLYGEHIPTETPKYKDLSPQTKNQFLIEASILYRSYSTVCLYLKYRGPFH
jgi:hypothetical protein